MILPDNVYNTLKWLVQIVLPACATLYFALAGIWGFPYGEQVVGTIAAITTFLGVCIGISNTNYKKGEMDGTLHVDTENAPATLTQVEFADELAEILKSGKSTITLKINPDANLVE